MTLAKRLRLSAMLARWEANPPRTWKAFAKRAALQISIERQLHIESQTCTLSPEESERLADLIERRTGRRPCERKAMIVKHVVMLRTQPTPPAWKEMPDAIFAAFGVKLAESTLKDYWKHAPRG